MTAGLDFSARVREAAGATRGARVRHVLKSLFLIAMAGAVLWFTVGESVAAYRTMFRP